MIETALAETDNVVVLVYDAPDVTRIPLTTRSEWVRQLYPTAHVIDAWNGPLEVGNTEAIKRKHEKYLLDILQGREITHFYSSEFYGEHVSRALGANDCRIDPDRLRIPISATEIRRAPYANRQYLDPVVYRDLITKVVFLGAPSTGKTTLAHALADNYHTVWMPEYGREYWEKHQHHRRLSLEQLVEIAEGHRLREDEMALQANQYLFVDTDATTTFLFSLYYHSKVHPRLAELANATRNRYDLFFLCEDDIPYDATWDRSGEVNRRVFQEQVRNDLVGRAIPAISLRGTVEERAATVSHVLSDFKKV